MAQDPDQPPPSARALLRQRDYLFFWGSRVTGGLAGQVQSVTLGWHMYLLARETRGVGESAFMVGRIGLAAFIPVLLLTLPAGETADRYDRKRILQLCFGAEVIVALSLALATGAGRATPTLLLVIAFLFGTFRAFFSPANTAMGPMLVPRALLPKAIVWNALAWQMASIAGPAIAGGLIAVSTQTGYFAAATLYAVAIGFTTLIRLNTQPEVNAGSRWALMKEGLAYVWRQKIVFGAISLDLCAVLLGGATALLPVFAQDVLHVGANGFGMMRASPAIGATLVALWLAINPIRARAGHFMFGGVAIFGLATIAFGLSQWLWVSVAALIVLGGADMASVFVRQTLIQLVTPDPMRGRVAAVSTVFIGASNELGEFESGIVARLLGPVGAAIFGGVGALVVTAVWAKLFPDLRRADRLE